MVFDYNKGQIKIWQKLKYKIMQKAIRSKELTNKLTLSECKDGFWLYDYVRGINLSMGAKTPEDAFIEAITYYQRRTKEVEIEFENLKKKVDSFVDSVSENEDY